MQSRIYVVVLLASYTCLIVGMWTFLEFQGYLYIRHNSMVRLEKDTKRALLQTTEQQRYLILWRTKHFAITHRISEDDRISKAFDSCVYKNCHITFNAKYANKSNAVIFQGRTVGPKTAVNRTNGQVWIFFENESPVHMYPGSWKRSPWKEAFNWSMTYDSTISDIPFPYGELRKRQTYAERNYTAIALQKKHGALIVVSHCGTNGKRETFIKELQKYIPVKVLGRCGDQFNCGRRFVHDDCFDILNEYRYHLAFENSLCRQYFTEKLFDNFEYDTVMITRAGLRGDATKMLPNGTFIPTDNFDSIKSLGIYLKNLSVEEYARILRQKDQYFNFGYTSVYKRAMCDICKRMNNQDTYRKTIPDSENLIYSDTPCRQPDDIK